MAARITRAKRKISAARIPYRVPSPEQLAERVGAVLEVVHLVFTTGHTAPAGARLVRRTWSTARSAWPACCTCSCPRTPPSPPCSR